MKKLFCALIANADPVHISGNPSSAYYRAYRLEREACITDDLIWTLQQHYNNAVYPQSAMYKRLDRLYELSKRRCRRRSIKVSIEMYRRSGNLPAQDHVFYREITAALLADQEVRQ